MLARSSRFRSRVSATLAATPALALAVTLALSTLGPPTSARAENGPREQGERTARLQGGDPAARLQIVITSVNVSNDRDGFWTGAGDILLMASFWRCSSPQPPCSASEDNPAKLLAYARKSFNADSGEMEVLNRTIPLAGDVKDGGAASEEAGIAVLAGQRYLFEINAFERDASGGDFMGGIQRIIEESNGWGFGPYSREPAGHFADTSLPPTPDSFFCTGCGDIIVGDYLVTYEIRRTPLPDLRPKSIQVLPPTGSDDGVCLTAANAGLADAGPFTMSFCVDRSLPPNGAVNVAGLAAGGSHEACIRTNLPTSGRHRLDLIVDQFRAVAEMDEGNNQLDVGLDRTPLGSTRPQDLPSVATADSGEGPDQPAPNTGQANPGAVIPADDVVITRPAGSPRPEVVRPPTIKLPDPDLQVSAIEVIGSNGKSCVAGKNEIFVTVTTSPDGPVGEFAVQAKLDNQLIDTATISSGMGSSSEKRIPVAPVEMKLGKHTVQAIVDSGDKVGEENETNNTKTVEMNCTAR